MNKTSLLLMVLFLPRDCEWVDGVLFNLSILLNDFLFIEWF